MFLALFPSKSLRQQRERDQALASFTKGDYPLMFATDVAARGLDIKGVTHVFNFDMARCFLPRASQHHNDSSTDHDCLASMIAYIHC